jgi:hypothetical protein
MYNRGNRAGATPSRWIGALVGLLAGSLVGMLLEVTAGNGALWPVALAGAGLFLGLALGVLLEKGL